MGTEAPRTPGAGAASGMARVAGATAAVGVTGARGFIGRHLVRHLAAAGRPVRVVYGRGGWVNVNDVADLVDASGL